MGLYKTFHLEGYHLLHPPTPHQTQEGPADPFLNCLASFSRAAETSKTFLEAIFLMTGLPKNVYLSCLQHCISKSSVLTFSDNFVNHEL